MPTERLGMNSDDHSGPAAHTSNDPPPTVRRSDRTKQPAPKLPSKPSPNVVAAKKFDRKTTAGNAAARSKAAAQPSKAGRAAVTSKKAATNVEKQPVSQPIASGPKAVSKESGKDKRKRILAEAEANAARIRLELSQESEEQSDEDLDQPFGDDQDPLVIDLTAIPTLTLKMNGWRKLFFRPTLPNKRRHEDIDDDFDDDVVDPSLTRAPSQGGHLHFCCF